VSRKKFIIYCNPKAGKFCFERPLEFQNLPAKIEKFGRCKITVEKYIPKKSLKQLGYLHGGILPFLEQECYDDVGFTKEDWREFFKNLFGVKKYSPCGTFCTVKSQAEYTEPEMSEFIKKLKDWCFHKLMLQIPPATAIEEYLR